MKQGDIVSIEPDIASDLRTVASATLLADLYTITRKDGQALSKSQEIDLLRNAVVGALVMLWGHAQKHIDANNTLQLQLQAIDTLVHLDGFAKAISRQWLDEFHDGRVVLPGYREKNFLVATKKRPVKANAQQPPTPAIEDDFHLHDDYSHSYAELRTDCKTNHCMSQKNVTTQALGDDPDPVIHRLDVGSLYGGNGEEEEKSKSKSKRGCGGEREREREKEERGKNTLTETDYCTKRTIKKHAKPLPMDFSLTPAMAAYAKQRFPDCNLKAWFETFCAHHQAHGKLMKDWPAAWRTWVGYGNLFGYPRMATSGGLRGLPVLNGDGKTDRLL
jgi:hypothetical protein